MHVDQMLGFQVRWPYRKREFVTQRFSKNLVDIGPTKLILVQSRIFENSKILEGGRGVPLSRQFRSQTNNLRRR
jgi:hypothetical protein